MTNEELSRRAFPWLLCIAFLAATMRAFDASYMKARAIVAVSPDNLIYYEMILDWVRHGDSLFGRTLTPSPYFVDFFLQLPLALWTKDFEHFAYDLALLYCGLIYVALFLLCRRSLGFGVVTSAASAFLALGSYYRFMPYGLIAHVFIQNHTSEIFCSLIAASYALDVARRGGRSLLLYAAFVAFNVASSAFFITTFVVPVIAAMGSVLGTKVLRRSSLAAVVAATLGASFVGVAFDAYLSATLWPIRGDVYPLTPRQSLSAFIDTIGSLGDILPFMVALGSIAMIAAAVALVVRVRTRKREGDLRGAHITVLLVFGVTALVTCVAMPIARGAFGGGYELRYLQEPLVLATFFLAVVLVLGIQRVASRVPTWR